MCLLLAEFLRESLALGRRDRITLARELTLVREFLAVERVRFGERLTVDIDAGGAGECLVPPLLLQPLVENAVTHGIAHVLEGGTIRVTALTDRRGADRRRREPLRSGASARTGHRRGAGERAGAAAARCTATRRCLTPEEQDGRWRVMLVAAGRIAADRSSRRRSRNDHD